MQTETVSASPCRFISFVILLLFPILLSLSSVSAQQPFVTDDADTTPRRHFHFEFSNEFDLLSRSSFPNLKQNTADFELDYGLFDHVEIGIESPVLSIFNAVGTGPTRVTGIGDTNLSLKYKLLEELPESRRPALAIAVNLELPTGDVSRQLGSGLADLYMNGIVQKSLNARTKLRLNGGILFSGNQTTGVVGIKTRGTVFTGGSSVVRQFTPKLTLGVELAGAVTKTFALGKGQLQGMVGGNYSVRDNLTFDFGIVVGKFSASPRVGAQVGLSVDW